MKPSLPAKPSGLKISDILSASWLTQLIKCLDWAMNYRGDGKTVIVNNGIISAIIRNGGDVSFNSNDTYKGAYHIVEVSEYEYAVINGENYDESIEYAGIVSIAGYGVVQTPVYKAVASGSEHLWVKTACLNNSFESTIVATDSQYAPDKQDLSTVDLSVTDYLYIGNVSVANGNIVIQQVFNGSAHSLTGRWL